MQGVGYRFFAQQVAARLGVTGYVQNLRDGRVEVYAIGSPEQLTRLRAELARGPFAAAVDEVGELAAEVEPRYQRDFVIEHDW